MHFYMSIISQLKQAEKFIFPFILMNEYTKS